MAMTVSMLRPGQAFRIVLSPNAHLDYRLLYANDCRAYVEPLMRRKRTIAKKNDVDDLTGETILAEFDAPDGGKVNIAPGTVVDELIAQPGDEDDDLTGEPANRPPIKNGILQGREPQKRGDRHFDPTPQERPVRPNTIRAEMLDALLKGQTSLAALAKQFNQKTSLTVAHIHEMWKQHGYGYTVKGDKVIIKRPTNEVKVKAKPQIDVDIEDLL